MSVTEVMRSLDLADDNMHAACKGLLVMMDSGQIPPHIHQQASMLREAVRDFEARLGEYVLAGSEASDA